MLTYNLDHIVKSLLLKRGYSIHFYYEFLKHATDGMRFLNTTTIGQVNSVRLTPNAYKAVPTPCDFVDWVRVGFEGGERVRPLIYDGSLNRMKHYENNVALPYFTPIGEHPGEILDQYGIGDMRVSFGRRTDGGDYRFCVRKERKEIQLSADYPLDYVLVDYISDGLRADAATTIDPRAQQCLEQWMRWRYAEGKRNNAAEAREEERKFKDEFKMLRAMLNNLTPADVLAAKRSGYGQIKW